LVLIDTKEDHILLAELEKIARVSSEVFAKELEVLKQQELTRRWNETKKRTELVENLSIITKEIGRQVGQNLRGEASQQSEDTGKEPQIDSTRYLKDLQKTFGFVNKDRAKDFVNQDNSTYPA
jgi:hypothetical protein